MPWSRRSGGGSAWRRSGLARHDPVDGAVHGHRRLDRAPRRRSVTGRGRSSALGHHAVVRESLARWRGIENDTAGDGFYATFDGPARAIRCAMEVVDRVAHLGIEIRAGVHTGECEVIDSKMCGTHRPIGARVAGYAGPFEVLVSQTVKDLVAGSGLTFEDAGEHELKGVPDRWRLYRVVGVRGAGDEVRQDRRRSAHRLPGRRRRTGGPRVGDGLDQQRRGDVGGAGSGSVPLEALILQPADPVRQARHGALGPGPRDRSCHRWRHGWTTCAP